MCSFQSRNPLGNSLHCRMVMITSPRGSGSFRELPGAPDGLDLLVPLDQEKAELRREKIFSEDSKHILKSLDMCNMSLR